MVCFSEVYNAIVTDDIVNIQDWIASKLEIHGTCCLSDLQYLKDDRL